MQKSLIHKGGKSRLNADSRKILLCYKAQFRLRKLTDEIESKGYNKYRFARRGRNLIWALVCQGMLNDPDLEGYADKYGRNMSVEAGLMEWMRGVAINKVRLLLSDLVEAEPYRKKMEEQRYDSCEPGPPMTFAWNELTKNGNGFPKSSDEKAAVADAQPT